jgi:Xaa-Pro dipeptidase
MDRHQHIPDHQRLAELLAAERRALSLLDRIEALGLIAPGRTEGEIEADIAALAQGEFGVTRHWHDRLVRAGANTLMIAGEEASDLAVAHDDIVFVDLGPVFEDWEADVGRSVVIGDDPLKQALCRDLPIQFEALQRQFQTYPEITGAELYHFAVRSAESAGWRFGGKIAGHIVGEFNHREWPGDKQESRIGPANPARLSDPDVFGRTRYWIGEIHLIAPDGSFGGFYERLLHGET